MSSSLQSYEADDEDVNDRYGFSQIAKIQTASIADILDREILKKAMPKNPKKKFWMLFVEGQSSPTHKHEDYMTAILEAKRIMDQPNFKGARVYVLEATGMVEAVITKEFTHTEITYEQEKQN